MQLGELATPCLLLDRAKLERNLSRMRARLKRLGVTPRPHLKTAKCIDIARLALDGEPGGITVSTLGEAGYFFAHGIDDIVYAVGIEPGKLDAAAALIRRGAKLTLILDSTSAAKAVPERGAALGVRFPVLVEIDSDGARAGIAPDSSALAEIGRLLHESEGAELRGVLTHAGASYHSKGIAAMLLQ